MFDATMLFWWHVGLDPLCHFLDACTGPHAVEDACDADRSKVRDLWWLIGFAQVDCSPLS